MELETVWTGAHGGRDADLLLLPAIPEKRIGTDPDIRYPSKAHYGRPAEAQGAVHDGVLACLRARPCTFRELMQITGFGYAGINAAITRLRRLELVTSAREPGATGGRPARRYTLVPLSIGQGRVEKSAIERSSRGQALARAENTNAVAGRV
jgi:hypothetical protein